MVNFKLELETIITGNEGTKKWHIYVNNYPKCDICGQLVEHWGYYCMKTKRIFCSGDCETSRLAKFYCQLGDKKDGHLHYKVHINRN